MSILPSYPYPYFGNDISETLVQLLERDQSSNYSCAICGKSIILKEGYIEGTDELAFLLCEYCHSVVGDIEVITEADRDAVYIAMGLIVTEAINPENSDRMNYPWY